MCRVRKVELVRHVDDAALVERAAAIMSIIVRRWGEKIGGRQMKVVGMLVPILCL